MRVEVPYTVEIVDHDHPVTAGAEDFEMASEQYDMHFDRDVAVLAPSTFSGEHWRSVGGVVMPAGHRPHPRE